MTDVILLCATFSHERAFRRFGPLPLEVRPLDHDLWYAVEDLSSQASDC